MKRPSSLLAWSAAAIATLLLPWHMQQDGLTLAGLLGFGQEDAEAASALWQAMAHGRFWFWPVVAALVVTLPGALPAGSAATRARFLTWGGAFGVLAIAAQGLAIGVQGWSFAWLGDLFGDLNDRQFGMGLGGAVAFFAFVILLTDGLAMRGLFRGDRFVSGAVGILAASILLFTAWPVLTVLSQMFTPRGDLGVAAAFADRLIDRKIWGLACVTGNVSCGVFWNTLLLATCTATATTMLGLCFALIVTRTGFPMRRGLRLLTVLPIITPPFVIGLGLILIFGRSGVVNQLAEAMFGLQLGRWIYGFNGVFLAQVFSFTPIAFLVLIGVVEGISPTMEEASQTLRASHIRTFSSVTLPLMLPGLANAWLVAFVESLADFGNPIVLGGSFGVLSTEIFFAVVGAQQDFGRAAVLAAVMLVVALVAFILQRMVIGTRCYVSMTGKGDVGLP
ncbi:MAG TPA: ABC transporter permease subunit, partial [Roseomonas sp.]|nr:ABC transporter permease subunit [Roseomonas sp.]